jgi:serine/threonine protein phosphatase PrpC
MCIVHKLPSGRNRLQVINAGDSRVLLGRRDGTIVDGGGTDEGLTTDHKPNDPIERERIERCGGTVEIAAGGVSRLNGDLAVCRGFGDRDYKKQGPDKDDLENQPATASPELKSFECDDTDFVLLVCDGVSEGDFPNNEVVKFVADGLKESDTIENAGYVAKGVCKKAVDQNSKDNVTCMVLLLKGADDLGAADDLAEGIRSHEYVPGPLDLVDDSNFIKAYTAMAARADLTLAVAVEKRCALLEDELCSSGERRGPGVEELARIGQPCGEKGSDERREWFENWAVKHSGSSGGGGGIGGTDMQALLRAHMMMGGGAGGAGPQDTSTDGKTKMRTPSLDAMKQAVDDHSALQWDERMKNLVDSECFVLSVDASDGTTHVRFEKNEHRSAMSAWLPSGILENVVENENS